MDGKARYQAVYASASSKRRSMCSSRVSIRSMRLDMEAYCCSRMPTRVLIVAQVISNSIELLVELA